MFKPGSKFIIEIETVYEDLPEKSTVESISFPKSPSPV